MKIILLTPGTGSYHCGVCMRDNALAKELIRQGHDAMMLPMYLPLTLDESSASPDAPVFFGGISVYLAQKFALFRHTPRWLDRLLNAPLLLKLAGRFSGMTATAEVGELTHSMLLGEHGHQAKEVETLIAWLREHGKPDAVWLSTALLIGLARRIKGEFDVPVIASLQGEDAFLDGLPEPARTQCWATLAERACDVDAFIAPSRYYADFMSTRMRLAAEQLRVIPNGIAPEDFAVRTELPASPVIGYLARFIEGKGIGLVVDAFVELKRRGRFPDARLRCAGTMTAGDERYLAHLRGKLVDSGFASDVDFLPNVTREEKVEFLRGLTLMSVPATYGEAFGLYLIEAMAAGVPVVQPRTAAFTEIVESSGAGTLYEAGSAGALAEAWENLLADPTMLRALGQRGRAAVEGEFSLARMTERFVAATVSVRAIPSTPCVAAP
jgi:glycosyltransferase involved in cell wall biosynthesis